MSKDRRRKHGPSDNEIEASLLEQARKHGLRDPKAAVGKLAQAIVAAGDKDVSTRRFFTGLAEKQQTADARARAAQVSTMDRGQFNDHLSRYGLTERF